MDDVRSSLLIKMKAAGRSNELSLKFKLMETDDSRVAEALSIMDRFKIVPKAICNTKNAEISVKFRNAANRIFVTCGNSVKDLMKAWEFYSKSIANAPISSNELSLAYANRSAVLIKLKKYIECIEDINRALELNYPDHLKGKLLCRKIDCFNIIDKANVNNLIDEATNWLQNINLCNDEKQKFEEKLKLLKNADCAKISKNKEVKNLPVLIRNEKIPCSSDALTINYNENFGRHIVTTRKVEPGEILIIEKPYAKILMPEEVYTHCSQCLQVYWAMIPCDFCIHAMYCSEKCKNEAWEQYHDIECSVIGYLINLGFNVRSLFSMRLAILALREIGSIEKLKSYVKKADSCKDPYKRGFADDGIYHSDTYCSLYTLVTNTERRSVSDLFERALNAAFILYYLYTHTILFGKKFEPIINDIATNEDITFFGGLLLRHMQIIPSNIHSYEEEREIDTVNIGAAALPFCSLINHSCDSNVSRCFTKDYMFIYALVPIDEGAQIYDNYGIHYAVMDKSIREQKFKQYYFKCECIACKEDWPKYMDLPSFHTLLTDKQVKSKIEEALKNFYNCVHYATEGEIDDKPYILTDLTKMINILIKYVSLPCREVNNIIETLKRIVALTYGVKFEIPKLDI